MYITELSILDLAMPHLSSIWYKYHQTKIRIIDTRNAKRWIDSWNYRAVHLNDEGRSIHWPLGDLTITLKYCMKVVHCKKVSSDKRQHAWIYRKLWILTTVKECPDRGMQYFAHICPLSKSQKHPTSFCKTDNLVDYRFYDVVFATNSYYSLYYPAPGYQPWYWHCFQTNNPALAP